MKKQGRSSVVAHAEISALWKKQKEDQNFKVCLAYFLLKIERERAQKYLGGRALAHPAQGKGFNPQHHRRGNPRRQRQNSLKPTVNGATLGITV